MKHAAVAFSLAALIGLGAGYAYAQTDAMQAPVAASSQEGSGEAIGPLSFVSVDAKTTGTARIVSEGGKSYVELSKDFTIGEAPAIYVTLYKDAVPPKKGYDAKRYVNLGALKSRSGPQRYLIPATAKISDFQSLAIWCRKFDVTLSYARLSS